MYSSFEKKNIEDFYIILRVSDSLKNENDVMDIVFYNAGIFETKIKKFQVWNAWAER